MSDQSNADLRIGDPTAPGSTIVAPETPTGSLLDQVMDLTTVTQAFTGDIISTGGQITLRPGEETIMPLGGDQTFIQMGAKIGLLRAQYRDQDGMMVLTINMSTLGERVGVIGPVDEDNPQGKRIPLPAYVSPGWAQWWTWVHMMNTEFMNPNPAMVEMVRKALDGHPQYQVYKPRNRPGAPVRERTARILWDFEPKGNSLQERHENGLHIDKVVLLPDHRDAPLVTSYEKDGEKVTRPGFTGFVDVIMHNTRAQMAAQALPADTPNRADIQRQANSRLSLLTGTDERTDDGYSLRPTIGHLQLKAPARAKDETDEQYEARIAAIDDRFLAGDELSFFPIRDDESSSVTVEAFGARRWRRTKATDATGAPVAGVSFANANPFPTGAQQEEPDL